MHKKELRGWLKHIDFIVLDVIVLQICFVLSYWLWMGLENPYSTYIYRYQAILLSLCQLLVVFFTDSYKNIIRRNWMEELGATLRFEVSFMLLDIVILFMVQYVHRHHGCHVPVRLFLYEAAQQEADLPLGESQGGKDFPYGDDIVRPR